MRLDRIELREISMQLLEPFETSFGVMRERSIVIVSAEADGLRGWGECTAPDAPIFNEEFAAGAWLVLEQHLAPAILARDLTDPTEAAPTLGHVRGHRMAKAAIETALWDLLARKAEVPLWRLLGGERAAIACGVSVGLKPTEVSLLESVERELDAGYQRVKLKIAPGRDVAPVRAVRARFGDIALSVDANAAYTRSEPRALLELDALGLVMIEQPFAPGDLLDHAWLQSRIQTPVCLDESIVDERTVRQALELDAARIVNIKLGRVGGHGAARRIARRCSDAGTPVWCGGMLEAGIGRLHNAAIASFAPFSLPGDVSDSRRYWARDIVSPRPTVGPDGVMQLSESAGIGAEVDIEYLDRITRRRVVLTS